MRGWGCGHPGLPSRTLHMANRSCCVTSQRGSPDARMPSRREQPSAGHQLLAGPPASAEILPGAVLCVALGMQDFWTRVFRAVELKDHPLRSEERRVGKEC